MKEMESAFIIMAILFTWACYNANPGPHLSNAYVGTALIDIIALSVLWAMIKEKLKG